MGGRKVLSILVLLALVAMAQAVIPTTITQSVTPASGTAYASVTPTFICGYYVNSTVPVTGAYGYVMIDNRAYNLTYSQTTKDYRYSGVTLYTSTHIWYCNMYKTEYQSQVGQSQSYVVKSGGGGGCGKGCYLVAEAPGTPTAQGQALVFILLLVGIGIIGYLALRSIERASVGKKRHH